MTDQVPTPPPFPNPPPTLPGDVPPLIDTRSRTSSVRVQRIPEVSSIEASARQIVTGLLGVLTGCAIGYLAGHYFPFYGGIALIGEPFSPARDVLARGHMAIFAVVLGTIGAILPRIFAKAMLIFVMLFLLVVSLLVAALTAAKFEESKQSKALPDVQVNNATIANGELYDDESFKNRHPIDPHKGRITRRTN